MNNTLQEWLTRAPHFADCAALIAETDIACTCGKVDAIKEFDDSFLDLDV